MALAFTDLASAADTASGDALTSSTFSPTGGRLLLVAASTADTAPGLPTEPPSSVTTDITGLANLTLVDDQVFDPLTDGIKNVSVWAGVLPATPGTGKTVTATWPENGLGRLMKVWEVDGADLSSGVTSAIVQSVGNAVDSADTTATATLAAFADATNNAGVIVVAAPGADGISPEGTWTEIGADVTHATPNHQLAAAYKVGEDTSPSMTIGATRTWGVIAFEIAVAGGGAPTEHERSASISGTGTVTVANRVFFSVFERAAAIAATGAITAAGTVTHVFSRSAAIAATGAVTVANFNRDLVRSAAASATSAVTVANFTRDHVRSAAISAASSVQVSHMRELMRQAAVAATGAITVAGEIVGGATQRIIRLIFDDF